jgi:hypothetical protein
VNIFYTSQVGSFEWRICPHSAFEIEVQSIAVIKSGNFSNNKVSF